MGLTPGDPPGKASAALSEELLWIHENSYGTSASEMQVHLFDDTVVCVLSGLELMPNEQLLIDHGHSDLVVEIRNQYLQMIELASRTAVERAIGRRVISYIGATKLHPTYAVEIFRLAPETAPLPEPPGVD